ncbi:MAG: C40 family peptidase [Erysipelotrichaceae bacterium]|nr:C40 family peptidase [Erysipelotrichaceae bacterium]
MLKRRIVVVIMTLMLMVPLANQTITVSATNFEGKESKYYKLCSSVTLNKKTLKVCKEFDAYLTKKSKSLKKSSKGIQSRINETENKIQSTQSAINEITNQIVEINTQIAETKERIAYVEGQIERKKKEIETKENLLKDRIYAMQSHLNSSMFSSYLLDASSVSDFFSRVNAVSDITDYEKELVKEIKAEKKELENLESELEDDKASLEKEKAAKKSLESSYKAKLEKQYKELSEEKDSLKAKKESIKTIEKNLAVVKKTADKSRLLGIKKAEEDRKKREAARRAAAKAAKKRNKKSSSSSGSTSSRKSYASSYDAGVAIANKALSKQGCWYVWGACHAMSQIRNSHSRYFDCSGLVNWAHYQCGYNIGSNTTKTLVYKGKAVSKKNIQPGDVILFSSNGAYSGVHHTGIYIGGNKMVHAPYTGTVVQVADLSYYQREWYCVRRLY